MPETSEHPGEPAAQVEAPKAGAEGHEGDKAAIEAKAATDRGKASSEVGQGLVDNDPALAPELKDALGKGLDALGSLMDEKSNKPLIIHEISAALREEVKAHPNSLFLNAAAQLSSVFEQYFDMTMTAGDFCTIEATLYENTEFSDENLSRLYGKTEIYQLINAYNKAKEANKTETGDSKKALEAAKKALVDYAKQKGVDLDEGENFEASLNEKIINPLKELADAQISVQEKDALGNDDSAISTRYVYRQLYFLNEKEKDGATNIGTTNNSDMLYAELMHAKKNDNTYAYSQVFDSAKYPVNPPPVGSVMFFSTIRSDGGPGIITGIVTKQGEISFHTNAGLQHIELKNINKFFSAYEEKAGERKGNDLVKSVFSGVSMVRNVTTEGDIRFRGAFIPVEQSTLDRNTLYTENEVVLPEKKPTPDEKTETKT